MFTRIECVWKSPRKSHTHTRIPKTNTPGDHSIVFISNSRSLIVSAPCETRALSPAARFEYTWKIQVIGWFDQYVIKCTAWKQRFSLDFHRVVWDTFMSFWDKIYCYVQTKTWINNSYEEILRVLYNKWVKFCWFILYFGSVLNKVNYVSQ